MCFNIYGKTLDEIQDEKEEEQEQLDDYEESNDELQDEIEALAKNLDDGEEEITDIEKTIDNLNSKIEISEKELSSKMDAVEKRLAAMVQGEDSFSYIELLLSSDNIIEFYDKVTLSKEIIKQDKTMLLNLKSAKKELEDNKELKKNLLEIKNQENELEEKKLDGLEKEAKELESEITESKEKISDLIADETEILEESKKVTEELKNNTSSGSYTGGAMKWPVPDYTYLSSPYGYRTNPATGAYKLHTGIDIAAPYGNSILAAASGTVIYSGWSSGYGYNIRIDHGGGKVTLYAHASSLLYSEGATVSAGQVIAKIGSTGQSTGNHLHFEVRVNGETTDPLGYVSEP
jgi:murein DD-endopeptidase MepM/ murein hydrolase activator NlpD